METSSLRGSFYCSCGFSSGDLEKVAVHIGEDPGRAVWFYDPEATMNGVVAPVKGKLDASDLRALRDDLSQLERVHRDVLAVEPRIARPLRDAVEAAKTKYADVMVGW